ncbi:MAG: M1 family metallopeptidase, partial [Bacteroidales bacterium]|nr:M1 family metallopeptidase [Bacteroidales bacterium]
MKRLKKYIFIATCIAVSSLAFSQNYFQQEVNNQITVQLNDSANTLSAFIKIEYINNSPDTLNFIYFHLWPNAYRDNNTEFAKQQIILRNRDFYFSNPEQRGYIDSLDFRVNNIEAELRETEYADVGLLILPKALVPNDTAIIETPFFVKIPEAFSRFGHEDQSYQITQWYPKPAVYDKYGWHYMPYLDLGEFYSEFGSFDVNITVPTKYIVAATGSLLTKQELEWLEDLSIDKDRPAPNYGNSGVKTLRYVESNIHDFAWFADKSFRVELDTVILPHSGEYVRCWTFSQKINIVTWRNSVEYVKEAVRFYSEKLGDYPYNNCVAVDGALAAGAGMEYPGITVVSVNDKGSLENVIVHEVGHNWFYGILASNERQFPWIDEGFNSFYENRYYDEKFKHIQNRNLTVNANTKLLGLDKLNDNLILKATYLYVSKLAIDQACNLASQEFSPINYWVMTYQKPVMGLYQLMFSIGEESFDNLMRGFYERYKFKHVYPEDIENYFSENINENLDWFFNDFIGSTKRQDYKLGSLKHDSISVKNIGKIKSPLLLYLDDSLVVSEGFWGKKNFYIPQNIQKISIDKYNYTTDFTNSGNYYDKGKVFPKLKDTK